MNSSEKKPLQHTYNGVLYDFVFPARVLEGIKDFQFDKSDVLVVGYPKTGAVYKLLHTQCLTFLVAQGSWSSDKVAPNQPHEQNVTFIIPSILCYTGTTWLQEIVWLIENEADIDRAAETPIMSRCPLMELQIPGKAANLDELSKKPSPRVMNTHLRHELMANALTKGQPKVIVIMRNPKDTLVSYYHFYNTRQGFDKIPSFEDFFEIFQNKGLVFGDWFEHAEGWYGNKDQENFCFIRYEDMKADHEGSVRHLADFLGRELSNEQIQRIVRETSLISMKSRKSAKMGAEDAKAVVDESKSAFVRKGIVGDWINYFSTEHSQYIDNLLRNTNLPYQDFI